MNSPFWFILELNCLLWLWHLYSQCKEKYRRREEVKGVRKVLNPIFPGHIQELYQNGRDSGFYLELLSSARKRGALLTCSFMSEWSGFREVLPNPACFVSFPRRAVCSGHHSHVRIPVPCALPLLLCLPWNRSPPKPLPGKAQPSLQGLSCCSPLPSPQAASPSLAIWEQLCCFADSAFPLLFTY